MRSCANGTTNCNPRVYTILSERFSMPMTVIYLAPTQQHYNEQQTYLLIFLNEWDSKRTRLKQKL
jgi:hypothetical protein